MRDSSETKIIKCDDGTLTVHQDGYPIILNPDGSFQEVMCSQCLSEEVSMLIDGRPTYWLFDCDSQCWITTEEAYKRGYSKLSR